MIILAISAIVLLVIVFLNLGNYLVVNEDPVQSDVIVVLSGDDGARTEFAVQLFNQGYSDTLLFSGCKDSTDIMVQQGNLLPVYQRTILSLRMHRTAPMKTLLIPRLLFWTTALSQPLL